MEELRASTTDFRTVVDTQFIQVLSDVNASQGELLLKFLSALLQFWALLDSGKTLNSHSIVVLSSFFLLSCC